MTSFEQQVSQWLQLDHEIKESNERLKQMREKRQKLEESLNKYASTNNLSNNTIQVNGTKLKFTETRLAEPLTFRYLERSLSEVIKNPTQAKQILDYIKQNREIKTVPEIRCFTNK
jgi:predicted nuclease with TOPRIM domain